MTDTPEENARPTDAPFLRRRWAELVCAAALLFLVANSLLVIRQKAVTTDESLMIPAGYYHVARRDLRPVNEHPPVVKLLAGLPLVIMGVNAPPAEGAGLAAYADPNNLYWSFWRANRDSLDALAFWSRVPAILLTALLGVLVFHFARRLFGARAAAFAVALFALEPTVLAHSRVVQTDIPAALGLLLFTLALYDYLRAPDARRAAWLGSASGLAVVMKFSMVVLAPVVLLAAVVVFARSLRRGGGRGLAAAQGCIITLAALLTIQAAYLFKQRPAEETDVSFVESKVDALFGGRAASAAKGALLVVVPEDFAEGVSWQLMHARDGHESGALGLMGKQGWWWYFPVAFALKTTLPFLLLSLAAVPWATYSYARTRETRWLLLLVPLASYTALLMTSTINIGVRYYLPAYPFLFVAAGALLDRLLARARATPPARRAVTALVAAAFVWMSFEAVRSFPDQMSYMNQLASARPHYWYLSDSNVEWGDDVRELAEYLRARGETSVRASLLNYRMLEVYGVKFFWALPDFDGRVPRTRYVALGASSLNGSTNPIMIGGRVLSQRERAELFDEYRRRTPEKIFGGSIYLYRVEE